MRPTTRRLVPVSVPSMKRGFAILLATTLVLVFGAACGVQEAQEEVEKGRQVQKEMEKRQQELDEKLQEGQEGQ